MYALKLLLFKLKVSYLLKKNNLKLKVNDNNTVKLTKQNQ